MKITFRLKGGAGSGNFGHSGRPGKRGGSSPGGGGGGGVTESKFIDPPDVEDYGDGEFGVGMYINGEGYTEEQLMDFAELAVSDVLSSKAMGVIVALGNVYEVDGTTSVVADVTEV